MSRPAIFQTWQRGPWRLQFNADWLEDDDLDLDVGHKEDGESILPDRTHHWLTLTLSYVDNTKIL